MFEKVKVSKWKVFVVVSIIVLLSVVLLSVSFSYPKNFKSAPSASAQTNFLNVSISGSQTLGVNETVTYLASVKNSLNSLSFSWSITPADNNSVLLASGEECNLTFVSATKETYMLSVNVKDNVVGNLGFANRMVYDPHTSSNLHLDTLTSIYSYTIQTDGSGWYQAINGATGQVFAQNTSSSAVFNKVVGECSSGSSVDVKNGIYTVATTWSMTGVNNVTLNFESKSELVATNGLNNPILFLNQCNNDIVNGITINGNAANQDPGTANLNAPHGIIIIGSNNVIENSIIHNVRVFGVFITAEDNNEEVNDGVINSTIYDCGWNGISIGTYNTACYAINNEIYGCSDVGITIYGTGDIVTGNYVHDLNGYTGGGGNAHWGIAVEWGGSSGAGGDFIAGNTIKNVANGIVLDTSDHGPADNCTISGNVLINCNVNGNGAAIDLAADPSASYNTVEFNKVTTANIGLRIGGSACIGDTVFGNTFASCKINIADDGTDTIYKQPSTYR
jgi:Right handed beta helix region